MKDYTTPSITVLGDVDELTGFTGGGTFSDFIILMNGEIRGGTSEIQSDFSCQNPTHNPDPRCR